MKRMKPLKGQSSLGFHSIQAGTRLQHYIHLLLDKLVKDVRKSTELYD